MDSRQTIFDRIGALQEQGIRSVVVAERHRNPPALANMASCQPCHRFSILQAGAFSTDLARHGHYERFTCRSGDAIILQPHCRHFNPVYDHYRAFSAVLYPGMLRLVWAECDGPGDDGGGASRVVYYLRDSLRPVTIGAITTLGLLSNAPEDLETARQLLPPALDLIRRDLRVSQGGGGGKGVDTWNQIVQFLTEHFLEDIARRDVAAHFRISEGHVSHLFRHYSRDNFCHYLLRLRLQLAAEMLRESTASVGEIAADCRFNSPTYFIRQFRRIYGVTPGEYRFSHHLEAR